MSSKAQTRDIILSIYHEILLNEISIMRSNTILEEGVDVGDAIVYYSPVSHVPEPNRGLDILVLTYAIINGLRRILCGYDITKPIDPSGLDKCREEIAKTLEDLLKIIEKEFAILSKDSLLRASQSAPSLSMSGGSSFESKLIMLIVALTKMGLLHIVLKPDLQVFENITPVRFYIEPPNLEGELEFNQLTSLNEYRIFARLNHYFERLELDVKALLQTFISVCRGIGLNVVYKKRESGEIELDEIKFKTLHGLLFMMMSHASSLPTNPAVYEANVLPFLIETQPFSITPHDVDELTNYAKGCVSYETLKILKDALKRSEIHGLSDYQFGYLKDAFNYCSEATEPYKKHVIMALTSPTGTGKTHVFLIYALAKLIEARLSKTAPWGKRRPRVLLVYPRKALARDQLAKIIELVHYVNRELEKRNLEKIRVGILDGDSLKDKDKGIKRELRGLELKLDGGVRRKLCHVLDDKGYKVYISSDPSCSVEEAIIDWVKDVRKDHVLSVADVLVTNHSMLTKLVFENFKIKAKDQPFGTFIKDLDVLVIDEAHMYLNEELMEILAPTLLKLLFLRSKFKDQKLKNLKDLVEGLDIDIIVSSATLSSVNMISKISKEGNKRYVMDSSFIIGFFKIKTAQEGKSYIPPYIADFLKALLTDVVYEHFERTNRIVYHDYDLIIARNLEIKADHKSGRKVKVWRGPLKLRIALVTHPYPDRQSWTALAETLVAALHWVNATRGRKILKDPQLLIFIDLKQTLKELYETFLSRQILDAQDHADRVLLTGEFKISLKHGGERISAIKTIVDYVNSVTRQGSRTLLHLLYKDPIIRNFHCLYPYICLDDTKVLNNMLKSYQDMLDTLKTLKEFHKVKDMISSLNKFAKEMFELMYNKGQEYDDVVKHIMEISNRMGHGHVLFIHHGDLSKETRAIIESAMKAERTPVPLGVLATSTLEVGVDVDNIVAVIQYSSRPNSVELTQRMGRSGRSHKSLYVSTLILVLRNTGEDARYVLDQEAVEYVYNMEMPHPQEALKDPYVVVRSITRLLLQREKDYENFIDEFLNVLGNVYGEIYEDWRFKTKFWEPMEIITSYRDEMIKAVKELKDLKKSLIEFPPALDKISRVLQDDKVAYLKILCCAARKRIEIADVIIDSKGHITDYAWMLNYLALVRYLDKLYDTLRHIYPRFDSSADLLKKALKEDYKYIVEKYHRIRENLSSAMNLLTRLLRNNIETVTGYRDEKILLDILSVITPGVTDEIGRSDVGHYIITLKGSTCREIVREALKAVRPLWIGRGSRSICE